MWQEEKNSLYRKFIFKDFDQAFVFIEEIAKLAKQNRHHPEFKSKFNEVEIWLTTHSKDAVTDKDRKFAQDIDLFIDGKSDKKPSTLTAAKLFTDGGSRGNPGPSATGVAILDLEDNVVKKSSTYIGVTTNNQAEYRALQEGLDQAMNLGVEELSVYMDSELIIKQINGIYKIKNADLKPFYDDVLKKAESFSKISFTHVPRAMNKLADSLVNECLDNQ